MFGFAKTKKYLVYIGGAPAPKILYRNKWKEYWTKFNSEMITYYTEDGLTDRVGRHWLIEEIELSDKE